VQLLRAVRLLVRIAEAWSDSSTHLRAPTDRAAPHIAVHNAPSCFVELHDAHQPRSTSTLSNASRTTFDHGNIRSGLTATRTPGRLVAHSEPLLSALAATPARVWDRARTYVPKRCFLEYSCSENAETVALRAHEQVAAPLGLQ
jgi:hypothetical protein